MNVTFAQLYREFKKREGFAMTKDQFLLLLMRSYVDRKCGRGMTFRWDEIYRQGIHRNRFYLPTEKLLAFFRQYTTNLEKKK